MLERSDKGSTSRTPETYTLSTWGLGSVSVFPDVGIQPSSIEKTKEKGGHHEPKWRPDGDRRRPRRGPNTARMDSLMEAKYGPLTVREAGHQGYRLGEHFGGVEMGRLTKKKLDAIKKSRVDGYTQKETAERVGVDIKTVKLHDPLRTERQEVSLERRVERLETICNSLAAELSWLTKEFDLFHGAMDRILDEQGIWLDDYLRDVEDSLCPKCLERMTHDKSHFRCHQCGFCAPFLYDAL